MTPKWEIKVVENAGELRGSLHAEDVVVQAKPLITDIKAQLMFIPKQFSWTVGWRAYVWVRGRGREGAARAQRGCVGRGGILCLGGDVGVGVGVG